MGRAMRRALSDGMTSASLPIDHIMPFVIRLLSNTETTSLPLAGEPLFVLRESRPARTSWGSRVPCRHLRERAVRPPTRRHLHLARGPSRRELLRLHERIVVRTCGRQMWQTPSSSRNLREPTTAYPLCAVVVSMPCALCAAVLVRSSEQMN